MLPEIDKYKFEYLKLDKLQNILTTCPVAIQPSGLLEWHGNHNCVGLDGLNATIICERAISLLGNGVLMPTNWIGTYGYIRYNGTICFKEKTTKNVFYEIYRELMKLGFRVIVILSAHWGKWQMNSLFHAKIEAQKFAKKHGINVRLIGASPPDLAMTSFGKHAGDLETSTLMRISQICNQDLVDISNFKPGIENIPKFNLEYKEKVPQVEPKEWIWDKDLKDKTICNPEIGEKYISLFSKSLTLEILEMLADLGYDYKPDQPILDKLN